MRTLLVVIAATAAVTLVVSAQGAHQSSVAVHASKYGRILFDGRGFALYTFSRDGRRRSVCTGACAKTWPPFVVSGRAAAGVGARSSLLGTIPRSDGRLQVTYSGRPLYYYVSDKKPGQILCQGAYLSGGYWYVERANGSVVR